MSAHSALWEALVRPILHEGDQALILDGPFAGKVGTITRIDSDSATVMREVFDRDTPLNVGLVDVASPPSAGTSGDREPRLPMPFTGSAGAVAEQALSEEPKP